MFSRDFKNKLSHYDFWKAIPNAENGFTMFKRFTQHTPPSTKSVWGNVHLLQIMLQ